MICLASTSCSNYVWTWRPSIAVDFLALAFKVWPQPPAFDGSFHINGNQCFPSEVIIDRSHRPIA